MARKAPTNMPAARERAGTPAAKIRSKLKNQSSTAPGGTTAKSQGRKGKY